MKRVTGIGGIFFKANDPVTLRAWYKTHLGIDVQEWGVPRLAGPTKPANPRRARLSGLSVALTATTLHRASRPS